MKKTITFAIMAFLALTSQAQLKVDSNGIVQAGKMLINERDSVYQSGDYGLFCNIQDNNHPNVAAIYGRANIFDSPVSGADNAIGIYGTATGGVINCGVKGVSISGLGSYGVYGGLGESGFGYGAAIYGTIYSTPKIFDNRYAGFFDGPVAITSGLYLKGGTHTYFWTQDLDDVTPMGINSAETGPSISNQMSSLQLALYEDEDTSALTMQTNDLRGNIAQFTGKDLASNVHYGLSAEQLEKVFPNLVVDDGQGNKFINYIEMVPLLVQAINELSAEVTILRQELGVQDPTKPALKAKGKEEDADHVTLTIPDDALRTAIRIYDMSGKLVCSKDVEEKGRVRLSDYTKRLPIGTYTYSLLVDGKVQATRKMMVVE